MAVQQNSSPACSFLPQPPQKQSVAFFLKCLLLALFPQQENNHFVDFISFHAPHLSAIFPIPWLHHWFGDSSQGSVPSSHPFLWLSTLLLCHCYPAALFKLNKSFLIWWKWSVTQGSCSLNLLIHSLLSSQEGATFSGDNPGQSGNWETRIQQENF